MSLHEQARMSHIYDSREARISRALNADWLLPDMRAAEVSGHMQMWKRSWL